MGTFDDEFSLKVNRSSDPPITYNYQAYCNNYRMMGYEPISKEEFGRINKSIIPGPIQCYNDDHVHDPLFTIHTKVIGYNSAATETSQITKPQCNVGDFLRLEWRSNQDVKTGEVQTGYKRKIGYLDNDVVKNLIVRFPGRGVYCEVINISKDAEAQLIYDVDLTVLPSVNIYRLLNIPDPKLAADNIVQKMQNDSNSYKPTKEQEISKGMIFNRKEQMKKLNKSGCYIATAVYGSYNAPQVLMLRNYRDEVLKKTIIGRAFIKIYYRFSPSLAKHLNKDSHLVLNNLIRRLLDRILLVISRLDRGLTNYHDSFE